MKHSINGPPERRVKQTDHHKDGYTRKFRSNWKRFGLNRIILNDKSSEPKQFQSLLLSQNFRLIGGTRSLNKIATGIVNLTG